MKNPVRITIALDEDSYEILNRLKSEFLSQSEMIRRALRFYYEFKNLEKYEKDKIQTYVEMLAEGEHVILDIDHWITFLRFVESHPNKEEFWKIHEEIARAHAEEFRGKKVREILKRLEACNFFRMSEKEGEFTLVLNNEITKSFIKSFLETVLENLGVDFEIREDLMKLRLKILDEKSL